MQLLQENFPPPVLKIALSGRTGGFGQNFNLVWSAQHDGEWHASGDEPWRRQHNETSWRRQRMQTHY